MLTERLNSKNGGCTIAPPHLGIRSFFRHLLPPLTYPSPPLHRHLLPPPRSLFLIVSLSVSQDKDFSYSFSDSLSVSHSLFLIVSLSVSHCLTRCFCSSPSPPAGTHPFTYPLTAPPLEESCDLHRLPFTQTCLLRKWY